MLIFAKVSQKNMKYRIIIGISMLYAVLLLVGCGSGETTKPQQTKSEKKVVKKAVAPETITIYLYEGFPKAMAQQLAADLKKDFPHVVLKEASIPLPQRYCNKARNRYQGTGLLKDLASYRQGDAVIALTDHVIFKANELSPTYGIMGVSPVGSYTCVVSSRIPASGKRHAAENFRKLALHELGHAFGLPHCPDQHCYMVDAEHKMKFPQTTGFCNACKKKLKAKGWAMT